MFWPTKAGFERANLAGSNLEEANFRETDLAEVNLERVWRGLPQFPKTLPEGLLAAKESLAQRLLGQGRESAGFGLFAPANPDPRWNVVGVGIGEKVAGSRATGAPAVTILVRRKFADSEIPEQHRLPSEVAGFPTDVIETGLFALRCGPPCPRHRLRPIQPGCSIGPQASPEEPPAAGTLGAIVRDPADPTKHFLLSAAHVLSDRGRLTTGTPVFQPGLLDFGTPHDEVARLGRSLLWTEHDGITIDAGLAELHASVALSPEVLSFGAVAAPRSAYPRMPVCKVGRTSGLTRGKVGTIFASLKIQTHPNGEQRVFTNQTIIEGINRAPFCDSGDSGALILDSETKSAIALLIGGGFEEHHGHFTVATPLEAVLDALRVSLVIG